MAEGVRTDVPEAEAEMAAMDVDGAKGATPPGRTGPQWDGTIWRPLAAHLLDPNKRYQIIAHPSQVELAKKFASAYPQRFCFHPTQWGKFKDGTDNIEVGGFYPVNRIRGENVIFVASFHNNDAAFSQFHVLCMLCESFIKSLTIVLPYYPVGSMERAENGQVATASTLARLFSNLPRIGKPIRLMVYDLHTLQNKFYLQNNAVATLHTAIPLLISEVTSPGSKFDCLAFPSERACKRFKGIFEPACKDWACVICGKVRTADAKKIAIQDGDPKGKHCIIVDDLVMSGSTLIECAETLKAAGAASVSAYVTHAVFPGGWDRFCDANGGPIETLYVTNSNPTVTDQLPKDDRFKVLDLFGVVLQDLE